ncbi:alpha-(1,3)-fucosyltransferase 11-like [Pectinophora gossypiella]|uniref:alpha-(1,3)-fucosyltransferase 11-like n=1 Tax=Pectinophora gossypiella TaxID=13191 RepID=UPI00214EC637|nr:alpha-(1,3)-fucosyltransferase 11-like [Pectinophora gossypiella]
MSEKLWRALEVGVVPIYFGSPLVRDWLPNNKSAILLEDYPTPELLSQHLHYLLQNDTAYDEYLEHKTLGLVSNKKLLDEITARPYQNSLSKIIEKFECFVCERLHEKKKIDVQMMTKKDYDCPPAITALNFSSEPNGMWQDWILHSNKEEEERLFLLV